MRHIWIVTAVLAVASTACAVEKTQRDRDIDQCTYGVVVPDNINQAHRRSYIDESVSGCLKAKGYKD